MRFFFILIISALAMSGCKNSCRQLTERLCDCSPTTADRNNCLTQAASADGNRPITNEEARVCEALLPQCDCRLIDTAQGKERCGLARSSNASGQ
jgi:hypothetical protein